MTDMRYNLTKEQIYEAFDRSRIFEMILSKFDTIKEILEKQQIFVYEDNSEVVKIDCTGCGVPEEMKNDFIKGLLGD